MLRRLTFVYIQFCGHHGLKDIPGCPRCLNSSVPEVVALPTTGLSCMVGQQTCGASTPQERMYPGAKSGAGYGLQKAYVHKRCPCAKAQDCRSTLLLLDMACSQAEQFTCHAGDGGTMNFTTLHGGVLAQLPPFDQAELPFCIERSVRHSFWLLLGLYCRHVLTSEKQHALAKQ